MLLRSLNKHVKDQNWFAVFLDFFIVVVGILIAFQITNWSEASNAARKEAKILEQLHSEFTQTNDLMREAKNDNEVYRDATIDALRVIRDGVEPTDKTAFLERLSQGASFGNPPVQPATLTELFASGGFTSLSSPSLRRELTRYREQMINARRMSDLVLQRVSTPDDGWHDAIHINPDYRSEGESFLSHYEWERISQTRKQFQVILFGQESLAFGMEELIKTGETVVAEIEKVKP